MAPRAARFADTIRFAERTGTIDIVITGANGAVGRALIQRLGEDTCIVPTRLRALVRNLARARPLRPLSAEIVQVDYGDPESVRAGLEGANAVVHLAGSLMARPGDTLDQSNTETTRAVVKAAVSAGVRTLVYLSFPGADPAARNRYQRTKGEAENLIREAGFAGAIFRAPLILGPGMPSVTQLRRMATGTLTPLVSGGAFRVQPIALRDVVAAIEWALDSPPAPMAVLDLVGPETVSYAELLRRVGARLGSRARIFPVPKSLGWLTALLGTLAQARKWNKTIFEILFNEHLADTSAARGRLPFALTPLNETLDLALRNHVGW